MKQSDNTSESEGKVIGGKRRGARGNTGQWRTERQMKPMEGSAIRIRVKHLDDIPPEKVALAFWLLAKRLVEDKTDTRQLTAEHIGDVARGLDGTETGGAK